MIPPAITFPSIFRGWTLVVAHDSADGRDWELARGLAQEDIPSGSTIATSAAAARSGRVMR